MSVLLFKLRNVEDDEASEIRALLGEKGVDFYETTNGLWGLGYAAIWLRDDSKLEYGKSLIVEYQHQRYTKAREIYDGLVSEGKQATVWRMLKASPVQVMLTVMSIIIVAFVLTPFVWM